MDNENFKKCSSCGEMMEVSVSFCTNCGNRFEEKQSAEGSPIGAQLLELANEFLSVREVSPERFEFSSQTEENSPVQKVKIKYNAVVRLQPEKRQLVFWDKMVESSGGMDMGFFSEKKAQKSTEVNKTIHGHLLFGGKYGFEYGKLRDVVKAIAIEQGWKFRASLFKP